MTSGKRILYAITLLVAVPSVTSEYKSILNKKTVLLFGNVNIQTCDYFNKLNFSMRFVTLR